MLSQSSQRHACMVPFIDNSRISKSGCFGEWGWEGWLKRSMREISRWMKMLHVLCIHLSWLNGTLKIGALHCMWVIPKFKKLWFLLVYIDEEALGRSNELSLVMQLKERASTQEILTLKSRVCHSKTISENDHISITPLWGQLIFRCFFLWKHMIGYWKEQREGGQCHRSAACAMVNG